MRKLDPKVPLHPRDDGGIGRWNPTIFSLQAHRLGLARMVGHGHIIVTSGKTGSIKLWPETTIRCLASEASRSRGLVPTQLSSAARSASGAKAQALNAAILQSLCHHTMQTWPFLNRQHGLLVKLAPLGLNHNARACVLPLVALQVSSCRTAATPFLRRSTRCCTGPA
jgi:hypothetical protein